MPAQAPPARQPWLYATQSQNTAVQCGLDPATQISSTPNFIVTFQSRPEFLDFYAAFIWRGNFYLGTIYPRDAMIARVLARVCLSVSLSVRLSVCLCLSVSVTSRCFIETDERIELVLVWELPFTYPTLY